MVTFRNNGRRNNFRRNDRNFKSINLDKNKISNNFENKVVFPRKNNLRNSQNASKLFEKYNNLAREALSSGDKILSENYFQHADHFKRIMNENEIFKKTKLEKNSDNTKSQLENLSDENKNSETQKSDDSLEEKI
jgi:hypothetical protein